MVDLRGTPLTAPPPFMRKNFKAKGANFLRGRGGHLDFTFQRARKFIRLHLKGHCHGLTCTEFKRAKTHFAATETYKYWSSFDKNYNASVMKLKKNSIIVIPPGVQGPNLKKSA